MGLDRHEVAALLQHRDDALARDAAVEPVEGQDSVESLGSRETVEEGCVALELERGLDVEDVDQRQAVTPPHLEIVEVVRWRDLHGPGPLLGIGVLVRDDGDASADERQDRVPPDEVPEAVVVGMHGDRDVARAWSRGAWSPR